MDKMSLRVKIADFGLATFYRGRPFETMCGTQSYGKIKEQTNTPKASHAVVVSCSRTGVGEQVLVRQVGGHLELGRDDVFVLGQGASLLRW